MYDIILADPPWTYKVWSKKGAGRTASSHYPVMDLEDIKSLPIKNLTNDNCALFLWATWPNILEAFEVIEAWGFTYRTKAFTWVKKNKIADSLFWGMGYYTRANDEPCLLGVKGSMPVASKGVHSVIISPIREHSQKPDEIYSLINELYPNTKRLELFARDKKEGWDVWGNEVNSDIELKGDIKNE